MAKNNLFIDTNIFMAIAEGFDLFGQLETQYPEFVPHVLEGTIRELEGLKAQGPAKQRHAASLALQLIQRQHLNTVPQSIGYVDKALLVVAQEQEGRIATLDRALQLAAKELGIPVMTIKKRTLLAPA